MPEFVFAYRNPVGYTPTPETRAAWTAWFDGMGQQLADLRRSPGTSDRAALGNCGADSTELGGYSRIHADDRESASGDRHGLPAPGARGRYRGRPARRSPGPDRAGAVTTNVTHMLRPAAVRPGRAAVGDRRFEAGCLRRLTGTGLGRVEPG